MKYEVIVTQYVEVEVDESKFTDKWMEDFKKNFYAFNTVKDHVEHLAQLTARERFNKEFVEGYGPAEEMGIKARVTDVECEAQRKL